MIVERFTGNKGASKLLLSCDTCKKEYVRYECQVNENLHFCGRDCTKIARKCGGLLDTKMKTLLEAKYGQGVKCVYQIPGLAQNSFEKRYGPGIKNARHIPGVNEKIKQTNIERYGVDNPSKSDVIKRKTLQTNENRYGAKHALCLEKTKIKQQQTNVERYGVPFQMQRQEILNEFDFADVYIKSQETMRKNKTSRISSKGENTLFLLIKELFYQFLVLKSVRLKNKRWIFDIYVPHLRLIIEYDGMYWHGHDRKIEEIKKFKSSKDRSIYRKILKDVEQVKWAEKNNYALVRFLEKDVLEWQKNNNLEKQVIETLKQKISLFL